MHLKHLGMSKCKCFCYDQRMYEHWWAFYRVLWCYFRVRHYAVDQMIPVHLVTITGFGSWCSCQGFSDVRHHTLVGCFFDSTLWSLHEEKTFVIFPKLLFLGQQDRLHFVSFQENVLDSIKWVVEVVWKLEVIRFSFFGIYSFQRLTYLVSVTLSDLKQVMDLRHDFEVSHHLTLENLCLQEHHYHHYNFL